MGQFGPLQLISAEFSKDDHYQRSGSRTYRAAFDVDSDEVLVLNSIAFLPGGPVLNVNQSHPSDRLAIVRQISVGQEVQEPVRYAQHDDFGQEVANANTGRWCYLWAIKLDFGPWSPLEHSPDGNPLHVPVRFALEGVNVPVPLFQDVNVDGNGNGTPIVNSAFDYFDPPVEGDDLQYVLTVTRNEPASLDIPSVMARSNKLNAAAWNGFDPKTVKCDPVKFPEIAYSQEANVFYYPMQYVFRIRADTWRKAVLDQGTRKIDPANPTKRRTILIDGTPATSPVMLNGSGGDLPPPLDPAQIKVFQFDIYKTTDYGAFDMDAMFTLPSL